MNPEWCVRYCGSCGRDTVHFHGDCLVCKRMEELEAMLRLLHPEVNEDEMPPGN